MRYNTFKYNTANPVYNPSGPAQTYNTPTFVLDRTILDVQTRTAKGALNAVDLVRIETRVNELYEILKLIGYDDISLASYWFWTRSDVCFFEDITRVRNNADTLQKELSVYLPRLTIPHSRRPVVYDFNQLELVLSKVQDMAEKIVHQYDKFSGTLVAGEEILI